jgi:hypothetical protein
MEILFSTPFYCVYFGSVRFADGDLRTAMKGEMFKLL